jgi:hypothetical protein
VLIVPVESFLHAFEFVEHQARETFDIGLGHTQSV